MGIVRSYRADTSLFLLLFSILHSKEKCPESPLWPLILKAYKLCIHHQGDFIHLQQGASYGFIVER